MRVIIHVHVHIHIHIHHPRHTPRGFNAKASHLTLTPILTPTLAQPQCSARVRPAPRPHAYDQVWLATTPSIFLA
jgi:hypothetical protein